MAKKKKKSQEGSKAVISIIVVVIIALFGYFCKGELPFELPFQALLVSSLVHLL